MEIDWGFAGQVAGVGLGMVFALLIVLAGVIWLTGKVLYKTVNDKDKSVEGKKED